MNIRLEEAPGRRLICDNLGNGVRGHLTVLLVATLYAIDFVPGHPYETDPGYVVKEGDGKPEHAEGLTVEQLREKLAFYGHELFIQGDDPGPKPSTYAGMMPAKPKKGADWKTEEEKAEAFAQYERNLDAWKQESAAKEAAAAQWSLDRAAYLKATRVGEPLCENAVSLETLKARNAETVTKPSQRKAAPKAVTPSVPVSATTPAAAAPEFDVEHDIETAAELGYGLDKNQMAFGF